MDTDAALPDGDKDLILRDHADLGDGLLAEVLVGPEQLHIRHLPGPLDHSILQDAPLDCADIKIVPITGNRK